MVAVRARSVTLFVSCLLFVDALPCLAQSSAAPTASRPGPPARLAIEPNAILKPDEPLTIEVEGVPRGERLELRVLQDCDSDGRPEEQSQAKCRNPLFAGKSREAGQDNTVRDALDFVELRQQGHDFPADRTLWLRVSRPKSESFLQARFGFVEKPCSLFRTVAETFLGGVCDPGLPQVLRRHRQPSDLVDAVFEVRLLAIEPEAAAPTPVAGTRGASGVAWIDRETLLVTAAGTAGEGRLGAGLYRFGLGEDARPERLWSPAAGEWPPAAPLALGPGRFAFVRQAPGPQSPGAPAEVARLNVWHRDKLAIELPLPYKIHQLIAGDARGLSVLALTLGVADNRPSFLVVDLERRTVTDIGFHNDLYQSAMRRPGGELSAVAFENAYGGYGWQLALANRGGEMVRDLQKRDGLHDLLPAWRPEHTELAFLAQVKEAP